MNEKSLNLLVSLYRIFNIWVYIFIYLFRIKFKLLHIGVYTKNSEKIFTKCRKKKRKNKFDYIRYIYVHIVVSDRKQCFLSE